MKYNNREVRLKTYVDSSHGRAGSVGDCKECVVRADCNEHWYGICGPITDKIFEYSEPTLEERLDALEKRIAALEEALAVHTMKEG
jgi:hypothetical protein